MSALDPVFTLSGWILTRPRPSPGWEGFLGFSSASYRCAHLHMLRPSFPPPFCHSLHSGCGVAGWALTVPHLTCLLHPLPQPKLRAPGGQRADFPSLPTTTIPVLVEQSTLSSWPGNEVWPDLTAFIPGPGAHCTLTQLLRPQGRLWCEIQTASPALLLTQLLITGPAPGPLPGRGPAGGCFPAEGGLQPVPSPPLSSPDPTFSEPRTYFAHPCA